MYNVDYEWIIIYDYKQNFTNEIIWLYVCFIQVGKANGLTLLLDASTFDYTFHRHASEGFKIAVEHHLDQPLMSMKELDITPGLETQVCV